MITYAFSFIDRDGKLTIKFINAKNLRAAEQDAMDILVNRGVVSLRKVSPWAEHINKTTVTKKG